MKTAFPTEIAPLAGLSEADGGALSLPDGHPASLTAALERAAREFPSHGVVCLDGGGGVHEQCYPELLAEAARILGGLRKVELKPGHPVLFQLEKGPEFLSAFWACQLGGFVPVPISIAPTYEQPHSTLSKLRNAWTMLGEPLTLAGSGLAPRLRAFAVREGLAGFRVETPEALRVHPPATVWHPSQPDDLALLLLTSGSTGLPKAVRQTQRSLLSWGASVAAFSKFTPADVSINWMPLDHVGGIAMFHLCEVIIGCRQVHVPTEAVLQNPLLWLEWIERYRATIGWAPNFAFGLVNEQAGELAGRCFDLSSMKFLLNAGEVIVSKTARRFLSLLAPHGLPATAMCPAFGMSETCSLATLSQRFTLATTDDSNAFVELGEPIPGVQIRIVDQHDALVPAGQNGRLQMRGDSITEGYHENPEANKKSYTADGWFITGDLGVIKDGQLSITGREKDVIIVNGTNFYSHEIESAVEEIEGVEVSFTAACAVRQPGENTDQVAIFFCPTAAAETRVPELVKTIRSTVSRKEGVVPDFIVPLAKDDIPKTAIGKIQRAQLKKQFEADKFAAALARGQPAAVIASGLFSKIWREAALPEPTALPAGRHVLVFSDTAGLGAELARTLRAAGHTCLVAEAGAEFAARDRENFQINPARPEGFAQLFAAVGSCQPFTHVVYAWAYPPAISEPAGAMEIETAQNWGSLGLLRLLRSWPAPPDGTDPVRLLVVTSRLQAVSAEEPVDYAKAPILGLTRTLPHEFGWLECHHLDLEGIDPMADAGAAGRELTAAGAGEFAVRDGRRLAPGVKSIYFSNTSEPAGIKPGGLWLLSGGLGGIGREVARRLAGRYQAKLLLLGRHPLPKQGKGDERSEALRSLQQAGAAVHYEPGNLLDPAFVRAAVDRAVQRWGQPLSGVIHLAGEYHEATIAQETDEGWLKSLRPKLLGAWSLHQTARAYPGCQFINFSSVLGHFGALGTGAYAAANASLDVVAHAQRQNGLQSYSLLWSLWVDTGMGRGGSSEAMTARGLLALTPDRGFDLMEDALRSDQPQVFTGLDPASRILRRQLDPSGSIAESGPVSSYIAPRTELERKLAQMWQEFLSVPRVGVKDNFFELGGRSLLAARLFSRIEKETGRSLPLSTLFKAPTVESLAALLGESADSAAPCQVLAIQTTGSRPPFFCIPGGASDMIVFRPLSVLLGPDQPFYGLQARGLDGTKTDTPIIPITELVGHFIQAMKAIQPVGPYYIGGHCFGALLAYEMAQQLHAKSESVALLALLDPTATTTLDLGVFNSLGAKIRYFLKLYHRMSLWEKVKFPFRFINYFFRHKVVASQRLEHTIERLRILHEGYTLRPYPGRADLFLATDSRHEFDGDADSRLILGRLAQGGAEIHWIEGNHHTLLQEPQARGLAEKIGRRLQSEFAPQTTGLFSHR
jgi:acyl-CoA synthetase (AMP-forming)/AMP-acid ligase II/thioesterase domain-containing protein/NAD(P)-dependent dehydrogenase (short-subunit alcohol dehydrogenase family)/acyl carrier protein